MATLSSLLEEDTGMEHWGRLILVSDTLTDGSFLLHHFIQEFSKAGHRVILVSLLHTFLHYSSVASKFGVNLRKKKEEGKFVFVDGLSELLTHHFTIPTAATSEELPGGSRRQEHAHCLILDCDLKVDGALAAIETLLVQKEKQCILIDDLSVLLSVGVALSDVLVLVQHCVHLLTSSNGLCKGSGCVVVAVHQEGGASEGREEELLHRHLLHICHLHCHAHGLSTGYSKDVHGEVTVAWRDPSCCGDRPLPPERTAQFKLSDRSVQLFARGLSTAVL